jgi:hypothetical protein
MINFFAYKTDATIYKINKICYNIRDSNEMCD